jgi:bifunctional DNA-binding transcriptional regulator/antitoxin component of YhaV-PrlF toxin-antitoxin module
MRTEVSTKRQLVVPSTLVRKLGLGAGNPVDAKVEGGRMLLTPRRKRKFKPRIVRDPITGFSVLTSGPEASILTNKMVAEILSDFP